MEFSKSDHKNLNWTCRWRDPGIDFTESDLDRSSGNIICRCLEGNCTDTTSYFLETPWIPTALYNDFAINVGDDFTVTYPLKLNKGFQLWKWYFKLKNDIDLKLTAGYDYKKTMPKLSMTYRSVPSRTHEWFIRPSASYQFNKMASLSSYIEYRRIHEKLDDETAHVRQILQFELALMLRFD